LAPSRGGQKTAGTKWSESHTKVERVKRLTTAIFPCKPQTIRLMASANTIDASTR
jgi:hypothetical protein